MSTKEGDKDEKLMRVVQEILLNNENDEDEEEAEDDVNGDNVIDYYCDDEDVKAMLNKYKNVDDDDFLERFTSQFCGYGEGIDHFLSSSTLICNDLARNGSAFSRPQKDKVSTNNENIVQSLSINETYPKPDEMKNIIESNLGHHSVSRKTSENVQAEVHLMDWKFQTAASSSIVIQESPTPNDYLLVYEALSDEIQPDAGHVNIADVDNEIRSILGQTFIADAVDSMSNMLLEELPTQINQKMQMMQPGAWRCPTNVSCPVDNINYSPNQDDYFEIYEILQNKTPEIVCLSDENHGYNEQLRSKEHRAFDYESYEKSLKFHRLRAKKRIRLALADDRAYHKDEREAAISLFLTKKAKPTPTKIEKNKAKSNCSRKKPRVNGRFVRRTVPDL